MTEYKSEVKKIYAPIGRVYERLSDLNNLAVIQQGLDNPEAMERIRQQAGDKVKPEQMEQVIEKLRELQFDLRVHVFYVVLDDEPSFPYLGEDVPQLGQQRL